MKCYDDGITLSRSRFATSGSLFEIPFRAAVSAQGYMLLDGQIYPQGPATVTKRVLGERVRAAEVLTSGKDGGKSIETSEIARPMAHTRKEIGIQFRLIDVHRV